MIRARPVDVRIGRSKAVQLDPVDRAARGGDRRQAGPARADAEAGEGDQRGAGRVAGLDRDAGDGERQAVLDPQRRAAGRPSGDLGGDEGRADRVVERPGERGGVEGRGGRGLLEGDLAERGPVAASPRPVADWTTTRPRVSPAGPAARLTPRWRAGPAASGASPAAITPDGEAEDRGARRSRRRAAWRPWPSSPSPSTVTKTRASVR